MYNFLEFCFLLSIGAIATLITMSITLFSLVAIASILKEFERLLQDSQTDKS